jgi:hypothetical protein
LESRPPRELDSAGTTCFVSGDFAGLQRRDTKMMKTIAVATALLLGTASFAVAQNKSGGGTASPGASQYSPGHEMQNSKTNTGPGASEYSPGDRMHDKGTVGQSKGASEYSPGDRMNDKRKH